MARYARPRKFTKRRNRRGRRRSRRGSGGFNKRVLDVVRSTREIKTAQKSGQIKLDDNIRGPDGVNLGDLHAFFPELGQGTTKRERIGAKITALSLKVQFWVQYIPDGNGTTDVDDGNITARMFIIRQKDIGSAINLINNNALIQKPAFEEGKFLEGSNPNTEVPFASAQLYRNIMNPLNRQLFVSKMDKKFNLKNNTILPVGGSAPPQANPPVLAPTNFKKFVTKFKWKSGKIMQYDQPTDIVPVAFPYAFTGGYCNTNGTLTTGGRLSVFFKSILKFTDA